MDAQRVQVPAVGEKLLKCLSKSRQENQSSQLCKADIMDQLEIIESGASLESAKGILILWPSTGGNAGSFRIRVESLSSVLTKRRPLVPDGTDTRICKVKWLGICIHRKCARSFFFLIFSLRLESYQNGSKEKDYQIIFFCLQKKIGIYPHFILYHVLKNELNLRYTIGNNLLFPIRLR